MSNRAVPIDEFMEERGLTYEHAPLSAREQAFAKGAEPKEEAIPVAKTGAFRCEPCGIDFPSVQARGAHRRHVHPGGVDKAPPAHPKEPVVPPEMSNGSLSLDLTAAERQALIEVLEDYRIPAGAEALKDLDADQLRRGIGLISLYAKVKA